MIHYSTNWMGPVSTLWYEDRNIPYVLKKTSGEILPVVEYKDFLESYSCGRIDIYGLCEEEYWGGKSEYGLGVMSAESWHLLSEYLDTFASSQLVPYEELIQHFEDITGHEIEWFDESTPRCQ